MLPMSRRGEPPALPRSSALVRYLRAEATGGVVLLVATLVALVWANSPARAAYDDLWHWVLRVGAGRFSVTEDLRHWVNDGLMTVFFFVVGLEIKRELVNGELRDRRAAALPALAAVGGMVVPALLYTAVNIGGDGARGWAIPMATDIAFAVGVMAVLGDRISSSVKLFLVSLAIVDDIGAITVIALFYGDPLRILPLATALVLLALYALLQRRRLRSAPLYAAIAVGAWLAMLASGVHATLAGVALGLLTRARAEGGETPPVERLEHALHPWSSLLVVPLFALANAGLPLSGAGLRDLVSSRVAVGIALGLVVGKTTGVLGAAWLAVRLGVATRPVGVSWSEVAGAAALAGIGFTVSIFVAGLAFPGSPLEVTAKTAVLAASTLAAVLGAAILARRARVETGEL